MPESDFPVAYHGEYHYRTGSTKQQLTGFALTQFLFHKMHLSWDSVETVNRLPFDKYPFKIFSLRYEKRTGREFRKSWFSSMGLCTRNGILTNAGALFSDACPIPQSRAFCTVWNGLTKSRDAFVHRDYTMAGSEVHVDIYPDRMEIVSPGGMPDGSLVQDLDWRNVPSDRRNPVLADALGDMDYMERKGSGFGLILDAYENGVQNSRGLKPSFVSAVGSFRVILPNLNYAVEYHDTQDDTQDDTQSGAQENRHAGDIESRIVDFITQDSKIGIKRIAERLGVSMITVKRRIARMPNVQYIGHGYSGHWEIVKPQPEK